MPAAKERAYPGSSEQVRPGSRGRSAPMRQDVLPCGFHSKPLMVVLVEEKMLREKRRRFCVSSVSVKRMTAGGPEEVPARNMGVMKDDPSDRRRRGGRFT